MLATALLSVSALSAAALASPTCNACMVKCAGSRYRNDPYRARVTVYTPPKAPIHCISPVKLALAAMPVMSAAAVDNSLFRAAFDAKTDLPTIEAPAKPRFALIKFKHESCMYQAPFRVNVGDVVFVEADRGEHIGTIEQITTVVPKFNVPMKIIRHATAFDLEEVAARNEREGTTTTFVQKLAESFGLGIKVVDVEFQTDGNKMTVYFASKCFVDFRKLQRSLFRDFRCRIWLVNWNEIRQGQTQLL